MKNGVLYWYAHERAREALKNIDLKAHVKTVEITPNNPKEFYLIMKKKYYRFTSEHEGEALKWVNSLKAVLNIGTG